MKELKKTRTKNKERNEKNYSNKTKNTSLFCLNRCVRSSVVQHEMIFN